MTCDSKNCNNNISHISLVGLKCTLGKRNPVQFHWNRYYDNVPETKDDEVDFFLRAKCWDCVYEYTRVWTNSTFGRRKFSKFQWNWGKDLEHEPKDDELDSFLERCFFGADSLQFGLATSTFFLETVTRFQLKHWHMRHYVVPRLDQQVWTTASPV